MSHGHGHDCRELRYPYGKATLKGEIRRLAEDFQVYEELGFEPAGEGEHLLLQVEKTAIGTSALVDRIFADYGIHPRNVGSCGQKDRHAVATQWLSLHLPGESCGDDTRSGNGYRVLRAERHRSKLRRGTHTANSFRIRIRGVDSLPDTTLGQLEALGSRGMANYFGSQRFGSRGDNVEQALKRLNGRRLKRRQRGMLISSLRSYLFNRVLAERIERDLWSSPADGDVFMLRGSRSFFSAEIDSEISRRLGLLDISSCASRFGTGDNPLRGQARSIEQKIFDAHAEIVERLIGEGAGLQMRPMRVAVDEFAFHFDPAEKALEIRARLPAGSYVTSLLGHFVDVADAAQSDLR